jgi:iron complex transport system substrate-binding protein
MFWAVVLALMGTMAAVSDCRAAREVTDDAARPISMREPARRVIPLYGAFAEMLYAIGAGPQVVARTQADRFPADIERLPSVGTHMRPNVDLIIGLKPDLVIQSASRRDAMPELDRIREAGITVAVFSPLSLEDVFSTMLRLGILTGRNETAETAVARLRARLEGVRERLGSVSTPRRVFYEIRSEPLTAAGRGSIVHSVIEASGAENAITNQKGIVQFNFEALLLADPDVYIVQRGPMNRSPVDPGKRPHFGQLRAVREGKILFVDELMVSRPGPRSVDAVEELARGIYPERFQGP